MFCRPLLPFVLLRRLTLLFGKAFDSVSHAVLLHKLNSYFGVQGSLPSWLTDYLTDPTHFSVLNGQHSTVLNVTCGIPQGSVLCPSLFALYTNNLFGVTSIIFSSYTVLGLGQCGLNWWTGNNRLNILQWFVLLSFIKEYCVTLFWYNLEKTLKSWNSEDKRRFDYIVYSSCYSLCSR